MSLYGGYFVPAGIDPWGNSVVHADRIRPCREKCNSIAVWAPDFDNSDCIKTCLKCRKTWDEWLAREKQMGPAWLKGLPSCPCRPSEKVACKGYVSEHDGHADDDTWEEDRIPVGWSVDWGLTDFAAWWIGLRGPTHPGATRCIRKKVGNATQQCCYRGDELITGGLGAGTPDRNNPDHSSADVDPWLCAMMLDGKFGKGYGWGSGIGRSVIVFAPETPGVHLNEYMRRRPPNNGNSCKGLVLNGTDY